MHAYKTERIVSERWLAVHRGQDQDVSEVKGLQLTLPPAHPFFLQFCQHFYTQDLVISQALTPFCHTVQPDFYYHAYIWLQSYNWQHTVSAWILPSLILRGWDTEPVGEGVW